MKTRWMLFLGLVAGLSACKQADSVVKVDVTIDTNVAPIYSLRMAASSAQTHGSYTYPAATGPMALRTSLAMVLPRSRSGMLDLAFDGLDSQGSSVAHGTARTAIVVGGTATVSVQLTVGASACGNSMPDPGETCDDGNQFSFDGCDFTCQSEGPLADGGAADGAMPDAATDSLLPSDSTVDVVPRDVPYTAEVAPDLRGPGNDGVTATGGIVGTGGNLGAGGITGVGGIAGTGGRPGTGGIVATGGVMGTGGGPPPQSMCGNGLIDTGEQCDCGTSMNSLPTGCKAMNGVFYGDGKGCSKACTKEPTCRDATGKNQACSTVCGDGNIDLGEECDDGNRLDSDGCSSTCTVEGGFACSTVTQLDSSTCQSGVGQCLELPIIYRDFQPENVSSGGHPDFYFLGTKAGGASSPTTLCVPNSGGPARGNDSTARCWDIAAPDLVGGKPVYNLARANNTCACQFSDWNLGNGSRIPGGYTQTDSPLSAGFVTTPAALSATNPSGSETGTITGYTTSTPAGPIWKGTVPIVKDANSFRQWFSDDSTVNKTFTGVLEMPAIGTNLYQYASKTHLAGPDAGFFPLDILNPSQATLCNLWPYWNRSSGAPIWTTCAGDQYFFPPRVIQSDCPNQNPLSSGCWVTNTAGTKHDSYFTTEARYFFVYDGAAGFTLQFVGDDDLFVFINGKLVLDLGGIHQQLPGKVTVTGDPGTATIIEGGCLDKAGNLPLPSAATYGPSGGECVPANATPPAPVSPDDFRLRTVALGLNTGKVYEIAIFGADRHPPESNYQLTLQGFTRKKSLCQPN